jgi:hypothetical protein
VIVAVAVIRIVRGRRAAPLLRLTGEGKVLPVGLRRSAAVGG